MTDTRVYTVTAFILRSREYGEGHRLYSLLTREEGKIVAVARGIQKPKAKLAPFLQHFTQGEIQLARGRRFDVITQVRILNPFYRLRQSLEALAYASYFAELFDESLAERQLNPALFDLLEEALRRLTAGEAADLLARYVEISLVALEGYLPHLSTCAQCHLPLTTPDAAGAAVWPTWLGFSASQGGALCLDCLPSVPGARRIASGTVQVAQLLLAHGVNAIPHLLQISDRLRRELETTLRDYLEYRLERRLQSTRFLRDWSEEKG